MNEPRYDVIVVGAGVSGLATARDLQAAGRRPLILEARDRIGGRLHTDRSSGTPLDMGASWVHGVEGNPVARLLRKTGASLVKTHFDSNALYHKGGRIGTGDAPNDYCDVLDNFYRFARRRKKEMSGDESLDAAFENFLRREHFRGERESVVRHLVHMEIETTYGANLSRMSLRWLHEDDEYKGANVLVRSGYDALANELARGLDIRLRSPVDGVSDEGTGVKVFVGAQQFFADFVVVTVPLGVLQKGFIRFSPGFSEAKADALKGLGMGNLHKTFLEFSEKFWDETQTIDIVHGDARWKEFINLSKEIGKPILLALNGGKAATEALRMSKNEIADETFLVLQNAYRDATRPLRVTTTTWEDDPYAQGSYSIVPVGGSLTMCDDLAKPQGRVYFAGEHTNSSYPATVHGAYLSGVRAAKSLIRRPPSQSPSGEVA